MARRKGNTKAKANTKKAVAAIQSDNSQTVKDTHQLKDDPGGGGAGGNEMKNHQRIRSVGPKKSFKSIEIVPIMQTVSPSVSVTVVDPSKGAAVTVPIDAYQVPNSSNLFNNNQNSTSSCSSSDLRYLHKKFKRIASASIDADASASPINSPPEPTKTLRFNGYSGTEKDATPESTTMTKPMPLSNGDAFVHESELLYMKQQQSLDRLSSIAAANNHQRDHKVVTQPLPSIPFANNSDMNATCDFSRKKISANSNASGGVGGGKAVGPASTEDGGSSQAAAVVANAPGRYVCPFCQLNCTKPSVLRKHIRAHTNERPYPCAPCGFAFKTKSNLHKHYRSRTHALREQGNDSGVANESQYDLDEMSDHDMSSCSTTTSSDVISRPTSPSDERTSPTAGNAPTGYALHNSGQTPLQMPQTATTAQSQQMDRPYKPKFHKAALYHHSSNGGAEPSTASAPKEIRTLVIESSAANAFYANRNNAAAVSTAPTTTMSSSSSLSHQPMSTHKLEFLKEHISKIISQNEAIMEGVEPALQKKYHKITGISRGNSFSGSSAGDNSPSISSTSSSSSTTPSLQTSKAQQRIDDASKSSGKCDVRMPEGSKKLVTLQQQAELVLQTSVTKSPQKAPSTSMVHVQQPLNLTTDPSSNERQRKRSQSIIQSSVPASTVAAMTVSTATITVTTSSVPITQPLQIETGSPQTSTLENQHPQNPERSIIKSLLLNSRGLAVPTTGEGDDAVYTCPLCKISFRSADILQYHTKCHCQGTPSSSSLQNSSNVSPHSAPISPVGSPSHKYFRSNSFNLCLPEKYSPNTLKKLASSSLRHPLSLAKLAAQQTSASYLSQVSLAQSSLAAVTSTVPTGGRTRPENIVINTSTCPAPTPLPIVGSSSTSHSASLSVSSQCVQITKQLIDASLPSPGPLLGRTRLVDTYNDNNNRKSDESQFGTLKSDSMSIPISSIAIDTMSNKRSRTSSYTSASHRYSPVPSTPSGENISPINPKLLQMCGGDIKIVARKEETIPRFGSSGGSIISISPSPDSSMPEPSPLSIRAGLLSGGSIIEVPKKASSSSSLSSTASCSPDNIITPKSTLQDSNKHLMGNFFQFPPINSITGYNPLTLPPPHAQLIFHGGKLIPFVPGMPGPDSLIAAAVTPTIPVFTAPISPQQTRSPSPSRKKIVPSSPVAIRAMPQTAPSLLSPAKPSASARQSPKMNGSSYSSAFQPQPPLPQQQIWSPALLPPPPLPKPIESNKRSFNFTRIADNLSPTTTTTTYGRSVELSPPPASPSPSSTSSDSSSKSGANSKFKKIKLSNDSTSPLHINVNSSTSRTTAIPIPTLIVPTTVTSVVDVPVPPKATTPTEKKSSKFLRPSSLPLKPGTFTPKRHHGITPTANTLPLISPETPRPSKHCMQLYLNGHAYTYLGLKCSTKPFYCTVNRPQPVHFTNQPNLSIYSNWQICAESNPHPLGLSPKETMSLYDSRQRQQQYRRNGKYTLANSTVKYATLHSQSLICTPFDINNQTPTSKLPMPLEIDVQPPKDELKIPSTIVSVDRKTDAPNESGNNSNSSNSISPALSSAIVPGGYESNEDYTYVRGRGRGRYVCSECGIRCKKPSMLKKHIRTHTDVRPYTCQHCEFSFKTKGNLTKHMKSKAHYKKCVELGLNPLLSAIDEDYNGDDDPEDSSVTSSCGERTSNMADGYDDDSDSDEMSDGDDGENESSDTEDAKSRLPEHEAAHCLLSLSRTPPNVQNSMPSPNMLIPGQPISHPYVGTMEHATNDNGLLKVARNDFASPPLPTQAVPRAFEEFSARSKAFQISSECETGSMQPMDLTKPRVSAPVEERKPKFKIAAPVAQPAPTYAGPAGLLNSLMTLTDKVPAALPSPGAEYPIGAVVTDPVTAASVHNNDAHMQTYLTERALQKSKMKLSQMASFEKSIESVISATTARDRKVLVANNNLVFAKQPVYYGKPTDIFDQMQHPSVVAASGGAGSDGHLVILPKVSEQRNQRHSLDDNDAPNVQKSRQKPSRKISMPPMNVLDLHAPSKPMTMKTEITVSKEPKIISQSLHSAMNVAADGKISTASSLSSTKPKLKSKSKPIEVEASKPFAVVTTALESGARLTLTQSSETVFRIELSPPLETPPAADGDLSGMDTLAEIAAAAARNPSTKSNLHSDSSQSELTTTPLTVLPQAGNRSGQMEATPVNRSTDTSNGNNAKNIASAYLKMSSAEYFKVHGEPTAADEQVPCVEKPSMPIITDDSCGSSDPDVSTETTAKKLARSNAASDRVLPATGASTALATARTVVVGEDGFKPKSSKSSDLPVVGRGSNAIPAVDGGRSVCTICSRTFLKESQMKLHMNIHFMNPRKFRCEPCALNFRTPGHLQKHERSEGHRTKVRNITTFGQVSARNPRPFECSDCRTAFRIQGHLAKHIRSKTHVQKLECLQKLPFGTFTEIERANIANDIDTTDCERALASLKVLAQKLLVGKDSNGKTLPNSNRERTESNSEDGEPIGVAGCSSSARSNCSGDDMHNDSAGEVNGDADPVLHSSKRRKLNDDYEDSESDCD